MNLQELSTVMHHNIPLKIFIFNNGGYLTIKQTQELGFNKRIMGADKKSGISFPNYRDISRAHKIRYVSIKNNNNLTYKIKDVLSKKGAVICELFMSHSQEQQPKAINRRDKNGKTIPTTFEDMYPFIDKKLIKESFYND